MKGFKGIASILESYNSRFDQEKTLVRIDIVKGYYNTMWPGSFIWF
jgi:hypothetical protein